MSIPCGFERVWVKVFVECRLWWMGGSRWEKRERERTKGHGGRGGGRRTLEEKRGGGGRDCEGRSKRGILRDLPREDFLPTRVISLISQSLHLMQFLSLLTSQEKRAGMFSFSFRKTNLPSKHPRFFLLSPSRPLFAPLLPFSVDLERLDQD